MRRILFPFIIVIAAFLALPAVAQTDCTYILSGKTTDEHNDEVLPLANVYIVELKRGAVSDLEGHYRIEGLCAGTYTVRVSHVGCETVEQSLTITGHTTRDFQTEHHAEELGPFHVVEEAEEKPISLAMSTIDPEELERKQGGNLGEVLSREAGVYSLNTGGSISKPIIHGLHSNRVLVLNNGIRQEGQQWGSEHAPEIDPFIARKLTVIKGAGTLRYGGDAIGGVILVETPDFPDSVGLNGSLHLVGASANRMGAVSGELEGLLSQKLPIAWRVQGTLRKAGNQRTPDYHLANTGYEEFNFSAAAAYEGKNAGLDVFYSQFNTNLGIFTGAHIGNLTDLLTAFEAEKPFAPDEFSYTIARPRQHVEHELTKLRGYWLTGDLGKLELTYARQYNLRQEYDADEPTNDSIAALNRPDLHYEITTHSADLVWDHNNLKRFTGQLGMAGVTQTNTYEGRVFIPNFRNQKLGGWITERYHFEHAHLEAGIRYDHQWLEAFLWRDDTIYSPTFNYSGLSSSLGYQAHLGEHWEWSLQGATAWRSPYPNELFSNGLHHGAASLEYGSETLTPEYARQFTVALEREQHKRWSGSLTGYYYHISDFIYLRPTGEVQLTIRGAFPVFTYVQTDAQLVGFDGEFGYELSSQWEAELRLSVLRSRDLTADEWLIYMPADRASVALTHHPLWLRKLHEPYVTVKADFVAEQTRVPVGVDFVDPPAAYQLFHFEIGGKIPLGYRDLRVGIVVSNVFNTRYRDYLNRFRYFANETGRDVRLQIKIPFGSKPKGA